MMRKRTEQRTRKREMKDQRIRCDLTTLSNGCGLQRKDGYLEGKMLLWLLIYPQSDLLPMPRKSSTAFIQEVVVQNTA